MNIDELKADLPNIPVEVIEDWLSTHYKRFGWPPKVDNDWRYVLRKGNDLNYLQKLNFKKETFHLSPQLLSTEDQSIIVGLSQAHVLNQSNAYSMMSDGLDRFERALSYIQKHGVFPVPPVLERRPEGVWILDGNHRLTAYFYLFGYFNVNIPSIPDLKVRETQEFWIAS